MWMGFQGSWVQRFRGSKVQEFKVQGFFRRGDIPPISQARLQAAGNARAEHFQSPILPREMFFLVSISPGQQSSINNPEVTRPTKRSRHSGLRAGIQWLPVHRSGAPGSDNRKVDKFRKVCKLLQVQISEVYLYI